MKGRHCERERNPAGLLVGEQGTQRTVQRGCYADQPVLLEGMDGHTAWANKALLKRAGINRELISGLDATGRGYYGYAADFEPNGFLVDAGVDKVDEVVPEPSRENARRRKSGSAIHA